MTAIILDLNKPDPAAPVPVEQTLQNSALHQPWLLFRNTDNFNVQSGDECAYELVEHERTYFIDTWNQRGVLVLPPAPREGFKIIVSDHFGSWAAHPLIVHRNGKPIMGIDEHMVCDEPNAVFAMTYTQTIMGWVVHQNLSTTGLQQMQRKGPIQ